MTRPFPSIERLLVQLLTPLLGVHVTAELPHDFQEANGQNFILPIVSIDRLSGADLDFRLDRPVVDVDFYAADRLTAQDGAEQIRSYLRDELPYLGRIPYADHGVVVTRTRTIVGPRSLPHANPVIRRYTANYELLLHTTP